MAHCALMLALATIAAAAEPKHVEPRVAVLAGYPFCNEPLKKRAITLTTIAVGCIVAEGLGGVLKPILAIIGVL